MIKKEVDKEFLVPNRKPVLAADKCESDTELKQKLAEMLKQTPLQIPFVGVFVQREEVEIVGVLYGLSGEVRLQ